MIKIRLIDEQRSIVTTDDDANPERLLTNRGFDPDTVEYSVDYY